MTRTISTLECDVAVIGAGTAGLAAERTARSHGATTLLIDDRFAGTTCATVGCMPSKLLIAAADAAHAVRRAGVFGVLSSAPVIDGPAVLRRLRRERDAFVAGAKQSFHQLPPGIGIRSRARFVDRTTLALDDGRQVRARAIVIATGSRSQLPASFDAVRDLVLTNETIFDLDDLPASIAVIGAGPIGLELGQALARLGVETMMFDHTDVLAGLHDESVARELLAILGKEMSITLGVEVTVAPDAGGVRVSWKGKQQGGRRFERVLLAAGRPPDLHGLGLEQAGLALDEHGTPRIDAKTMQCAMQCVGNAPIFMAGDADHDRPVLHEAVSEGLIAGRNAAAWPDVTQSMRMLPFSLIFTDPPVAIVGEVPEPGDAQRISGHASYHDQGRAKVFARNAGRASLYADRKDGRLVGATLVAPGGEHLAHLLAWAIQCGLAASQVLDLPIYHPTYEEGLKPALREICKLVGSTPSLNQDEGFVVGV